MKKLFVVTHTQASHHLSKLVGGWYDSELTKLGLEQAHATAVHLRKLIVSDKPVVISSDFKRALQTAKPIADAFGCDIQASEDFREISYGEAEGKPDKWLKEHWVPIPDSNRLDHRHLPGNETRRELATRISRGMEPILQSSDGTFILITHGFAQTFVISSWIGLPIANAGFVNFASVPGGITCLVEDDHFRNRAVVSLSDNTHLVGE